MNMDHVNKWLTLGANIGVLAGIFLLIAEINHNSAVSEMQFYIDRRAGVDELSSIMLDDDFASLWNRSISQPESISSADFNRLGAYLSRRTASWRLNFVMEDRGFRGRGSAQNYLNNTIAAYFGNPVAQLWWKTQRNSWPDGFAAVMDESMKEVSPTANREFSMALEQELRALQHSPADPNAARIRAHRAASNNAIQNHDAAGVVAYLAPEYQITTGSGALYHDGPEEEAVLWQEIFSANEDIVYVRTPAHVEVSSYLPRAAERGNWVGSWTTPSGLKEVGGSYFATWIKVEDAWKIRSEEFVTLFCTGAEC